jgi:hypothetical protein
MNAAERSLLDDVVSRLTALNCRRDLSLIRKAKLISLTINRGSRGMQLMERSEYR